jgi:hypothetical protein
MAGITGLIAVAVIAIIASLLLALLIKMTKGIIAIALLALIVIGGFFIYQDVSSLQQQLVHGEKQFCLVENGRLLAMFTTIDSQAQPVKNLTIARQRYAAGGANALRTGSILFIVTPEITTHAGDINFSGVMLSKEQTLSMLRSEDPRPAFVENYAVSNNLTNAVIAAEPLGTADNLKGTIFAELVSVASAKGKLPALFRQGIMTTEPQHFILRFARFIPEAMLPGGI